MALLASEEEVLPINVEVNFKRMAVPIGNSVPEKNGTFVFCRKLGESHFSRSI